MNAPPRWAEWVLGWLLKDDWQSPIGDFHEYYNHLLEERGEVYARWWYRRQVIAILPVRLFEKGYWAVVMLANYLRTGIRSLSRKKGYAALNIAGLMIGLTCCILIFQFVAYQFSYDTFHTRGDRIHRVVRSITLQDGVHNISARQGQGVGPAIANENPDVIQYARVFSDFFQEGPTVSYNAASGARTFKESRAFYADPSLLTLFTFPLLKGDPATALQKPQTLLITERAARKYFGDEDPIGKSLEYRSIDFVSNVYTVAGVLKDVPANSHLQFDMLLPMQDLLSSKGEREQFRPWNLAGEFTAYLEVRPDANISSIESHATQLFYDHQGEGLEAMNASAEIRLQPLADVYLDNETEAGLVETGRPDSIYYFTIIALITLAVALVNYTNLVTARALNRSQEVGVRKTIGASREQLVGQFLTESALTHLIALLLSIGLAALMTPLLNQLVHLEISFWHGWSNVQFLGALGAVFDIGVLLAGLYPSMVLSSFQPTSLLQKWKSSKNDWFTPRKVLVVIQFAASIALFTGTVLVYSQLNYVRTMDIGLDVNQVLVITSPRALPVGMDGPKAESLLKHEVSTLTAVRDASFSGNLVGKGFNVGTMALLAGEDPSTAREVRVTGIDHAFSGLYAIELVAGQPFHAGMPSWFEGSFDVPRPVLINETAVQTLGLPTNEAALGKVVVTGNLTYVVQGVLEDFNWSSAHHSKEAVFFRHLPVNRFLSLKIAESDMVNTVASIQEIYEGLFPDDVFQYQFADAVYDEQYRTDEQFATLFSMFAILAIAIACLGLFGLVSFTASQRRKEISIRKVLGASSGSIVKLLSIEFLLLVMIAWIIGTPVAWYFTNSWLDQFAYRIEFSVWMVAIAGFATLIIALFTVGYQAIRAATSNPVNNLRYE